MALLDKSKFFAMDNLEYKDVEIKGLDGSIRLKNMSIKDQLEFEELASKKDVNQKDLMLHLVLKSCIDEKGELLFSEEDLPALENYRADIMIELFKAILEMNSLSQDEVDSIAKN